MRKFGHVAFVLIFAIAAGLAMSPASFAADQKPKAAAASDKAAPGQACRAHQPGSDAYKACIQEHAKSGKTAKDAKSQAAKDGKGRAKDARNQTAKSKGQAKDTQQKAKAAKIPAKDGTGAAGGAAAGVITAN
jgi:hypothetical protein